ncbi:hypothetical protein ES708_34193 [subsurface metagenome]
MGLGTQKDNIQDMVAKNRGFYDNTSKGEKHGMAKLTNKQVRKIKRDLREGTHGIGVFLAREFNVTPTTISAIKYGRNWRSVV